MPHGMPGIAPCVGLRVSPRVATRRLVGVLTLVACVLAAAATATAQAQNTSPRRTVPTLTDLSAGFESLAGSVNQSVVSIVVSGYGPVRTLASTTDAIVTRQRGGGSGVIVDASGLVLTNWHVVENATRIEVALPPAPATVGQARSIVQPRGEIVEAKLVGADVETDLAVLRVPRGNLAPLQFADSDDLKPGAIVFALGSPLGLGSSVSMGIVSAVGRQLSPDDSLVYVQTDAPINPGNSGGPLIDSSGRIVGINTRIASQSGGSEGLGFAVPSNIARTVFEQLKATGRVRRGTIGVTAQSITPQLAAGLQLERLAGAVVGDVLPGSPGEKAGLIPGDVILTLDGKPMENGRQFEVNIYRRRIGDTVTLEYFRGNERKRTTAAVAERPDDPSRFAQMADPQDNLVPRLGILGLEVDSELRQVLPQLRLTGGLLVAARALSAPPSEQGLVPGDVIYSLNGQSITGLADFKQRVAALPAGAPCVLQIQRGARLMYVAVEID